MLNKLSVLATNQLIRHNSISDEEKEIYSYGIFILLSYLFYTLFTLVCGMVLKCIGGSIIFYFSFQIIRKFAGGYHASTETRCEILSMISIFVSVALIRLSDIYDYKTVILVITTFSIVCIFILCPLDTPEKTLTEEEFKHFRRISQIVLLVISTVVFISAVLRFDFLIYPTSLSLILESVLLIAGKIKQKCLKEKDVRK